MHVQQVWAIIRSHLTALVFSLCTPPFFLIASLGCDNDADAEAEPKMDHELS